MLSLPTALLWPVRYAVEAVLVTTEKLPHRLGLATGVSWLLALPILLMLVWLLVLPLVIAAAKNAQRMVQLTDAVAVLRRSLRAGTAGSVHVSGVKEEVGRLRRRSTARQWKSLVPQLPQLLQLLQLLLALSTVLQQADAGQAGAGPLIATLAASFRDATLAGAPFRSTVLHAGQAPTIGILLALVAGAAVFAGQALTLRFNITNAATRAPIWRFRPTPLFFAPPVVVLIGLNAPTGTALDLALSTSSTVLQQVFLLARYPLPTTRADLLRRARLVA